MTWKSGKHGHHTGRTVRSSRSSARREGILVKKVTQTTETSEENPTESIVETTNYSLGKQNRWLMPGIIKTSVNPREVVGEEDHFVLVEQRMDDERTQNCRRGLCISVYNSSTKKTRKPRHKYGQARYLRSDSSQNDLEFEVHYPTAKGNWPLNSEAKSSHKCRVKRKGSSKNRQGKWSMIVEDEYSIHENENYMYDDEEDNFDGDDDMYLEEGRAVSLVDFLFTEQGNRAKRECAAKSNCYQEKVSSVKNIIVVDDIELVTEHERMVTRARKMDALIHGYIRSFVPRCQLQNEKRLKRMMVFLDEAAQMDREYEKEILINSSKVNENVNEESFDFMPEVHPSCEVCLQGAEILPSELKQSWGESYREGSCIPRKFAIDLSGLMDSSLENVDLAVMAMLFELNDHQEKNTHDAFCKASVKLVLDDGLAALNTSLQTLEMINNEFLDLIRCESGSNVSTDMKDIVDAGVKCIAKYEILQKPMKVIACKDKKTFYTSEVFVEVLGWEGKSCPEREALQEAKKEVEREKGVPEQFFVSSLPEKECGICFEDLKDEDSQNCTTLTPCRHTFCNSCWQVYIKAMLNVGETNLLCPGYQCQIALDNITIMSLATSWYGRYFSWKIKGNLAKNPTMKHCPSNGCKLIMQITPCNKGSQKTFPTCNPLPVVCACNQSWCFKCQEPAHWPSQCEQAQTTRDEYRKMSRYSPRKKEITSVMVKKCPNCSYPIEKFYGCDHMYCIMCRHDFCWRCLQLMQSHNYTVCHNRNIVSSEILIPKVPKHKTQTLTEIAWSNYLARKTTNMRAVQRKLKSMARGLDAYCYLKTKALKKTKCSRMTLVLEGMIKHNALQQVQDAFNFKLQVHIVVEGVAIVLLKRVKGCDSLQNDLTRLLFIVEGLDKLLGSICFCNEEVVTKLRGLIERGKMCIKDVKRHTVLKK